MKFMSRKKFDHDAWYVNLIGGVLVLVLVLVLNYLTDDRYEELLNRTGKDLPSGKGGKLGLLIIKLLDIEGGRALITKVLVGFSLLCFWWGYRGYIKRNK